MTPMTTDEATVRFVIAGRVQGVGFRMFAHSHAVSLGLKGWVRNLPTGEVEAVAAGTHERLAQFRALLSRGPQGAEVKGLDELDVDQPADLPDPFQVIG